MYTVLFEKSVQKFIKKHVGGDVVSRLQSATKIIATDPYTHDLDIVALVGYEAKYRLRIGKYRFLYTVDESNVIVIFFDAGSRGDIYKK